jgi:hypothetical protein
MAILSLSTCFAQSERGAITGMVTDATNAAIPNASVKITQMGTNATTAVSSTASGEYSVANLAPGAYKLEASQQGFRTAIVDNIVVTAGATARADVNLEIGGVSQSVEVQAQSAQVQTEDAKVSTAVSNTLVDQLPLVVGGAMRSPFDLVTTVPEAKNGTNLALGGGQGGAFAATFDGVSVNTNRWSNAPAGTLELLSPHARPRCRPQQDYGRSGALGPLE